MKTKIMASWEYPENLDCMTPCWLWSHMSSLYDLCTVSTKTGAAIATWRENPIVAFISGTGGPLWIQKQFPVLNCATVQAQIVLAGAVCSDCFHWMLKTATTTCVSATGFRRLLSGDHKWLLQSFWRSSKFQKLMGIILIWSLFSVCWSDRLCSSISLHECQ